MLGKKIEPINIEQQVQEAGLGSEIIGMNIPRDLEILTTGLSIACKKIDEVVEDYMRFKNLLEQKINELQTTLTETNMQIAQIAAASGSKTLVEANYERPPVDDFEKEFGKMQTTDDKANLGPMDAPKFEDGENPFE